mgnify:FL=1
MPDPVIPPADTTAPVISITGTSPVSIDAGSVYLDAGATALDAVDGNLTSSIVSGGTFVDTATAGSYTKTYTATDIAGNATTATRTVNVVAPPPPPDTTPPAITILGDNPKTILLGSVYLDAGATALDAVDGNLTSSIVLGGTFINTATIGAYTITYTATDLSGNTATATRAVNVVASFSTSYLENSQMSLPGSLSGGRFYHCANVSSGFATLLAFGSIFTVSDGGVYLDSIGVRGVAGSGTVTSANLKVYSYSGAGGFNAALSFRGDYTFGSLVATSDTFNPSTWSGAVDTGTNPSDFPYDNMTFPHVFLPEGNYFMTFGLNDCSGGTGNYFGVKGSGNALTQGFQGLFYFDSPARGGLVWDHLGGFGFDYIINGGF